MKFIFVAIVVGAFTLSFVSVVNTDILTPFFQKLAFFRKLVFKDTFKKYPVVREARIDLSFSYANKLGIQYFDTQSAILEAWRRCDAQLSLVPLSYSSLAIFENPTIDDTQNVTEKFKCLYYCIMNGTGVLTDEGFQDELYMDYIRKLRFNSTSFDIGEDELMARRELSYTIDNLTGSLNSYSMYKSVPRSMNDIIESYAQAASECKRFRLPKESDFCEEAYFILWCMMAKNQRNGLNSLFYPLWLRDYSDPVMSRDI